MSTKKSFALVGASNRGLYMYALPMATQFKDSVTFAGIYDINRGRADYVSDLCGGVPVFDDFDELLSRTSPDCVIVATSDYVHSRYIVKALEYGCDVFTEKPIVINAQQCRDVLRAAREYRGNVGVCFNMRYADFLVQLKRLIDSGILGKIFNVHFEWLLTRNMEMGAHGASYYRRWNARMNKSGGLLVTKATHHFDMINWLIDQRPVRVSAFGKLNLYGKNGPYNGPRCSLCAHRSECEFANTITARAQSLYVDNEKYDGYMIDGCVYADDIDANDTISLSCLYDGGALMAYSETATAMYEGFKLSINGSKARMEVQKFSTKDESHPDETRNSIRIIGLDHKFTSIPFPESQDQHDSADPKVQRMLFLGEQPELPSQRAGVYEGVYSALIGIAANISISDGRIVDISELVGDSLSE